MRDVAPGLAGPGAAKAPPETQIGLPLPPLPERPVDERIVYVPPLPGDHPEDWTRYTATVDPATGLLSNGLPVLTEDQARPAMHREAARAARGRGGRLIRRMVKGRDGRMVESPGIRVHDQETTTVLRWDAAEHCRPFMETGRCDQPSHDHRRPPSDTATSLLSGG